MGVEMPTQRMMSKEKLHKSFKPFFPHEITLENKPILFF
jgi:hypothetical protein